MPTQPDNSGGARVKPSAPTDWSQRSLAAMSPSDAAHWTRRFTILAVVNLVVAAIGLLVMFPIAPSGGHRLLIGGLGLYLLFESWHKWRLVRRISAAQSPEKLSS